MPYLSQRYLQVLLTNPFNKSRQMIMSWPREQCFFSIFRDANYQDIILDCRFQNCASAGEWQMDGVLEAGWRRCLTCKTSLPDKIKRWHIGELKKHQSCSVCLLMLCWWLHIIFDNATHRYQIDTNTWVGIIVDQHVIHFWAALAAELYLQAKTACSRS